MATVFGNFMNAVIAMQGVTPGGMSPDESGHILESCRRLQCLSTQEGSVTPQGPLPMDLERASGEADDTYPSDASGYETSDTEYTGNASERSVGSDLYE